MMSKLQSLPIFFRSEASPKVQDSAFPPFKVEHRYKGVYERAGFDVNVSGTNGESRNRSSSSGGYLTPPKSTSPSTSKMYATSQKRVDSGSERLQNIGQTANKSALELRKLSPSPYNNIPASATSLPGFHDHKESIVPYHTAPYTSGGKTPYQNDGDIVFKQNTFDTSKHEENILPVKASDHQMNHKNLRLDLGIPNNSDSPFEYTTSKTENITSATYETAPLSSHSHNSPVKSANIIEDGTESNEIPYPEFDSIPRSPEVNNKSQQVEDSDDDQQFDFNSPFQQQDRFSPNNNGQENESSKYEGKDAMNNAMSKQHPDDKSPKIPPRNEQRIAYDSPTMSPTFVSRFDSFVKNSKKNSRESRDSGLLNPSANNGCDNFVKQSQRVSNLSMVSSIISKESGYEDDEIEKELERQLESLKAGCSLNDNGEYQDEKDEQFNRSEFDTHDAQPKIPMINVQNLDTPNDVYPITPNSSSHSANTSGYVSATNLNTYGDAQDETHSTFSFETVEPLTIRQNDSYTSEKETNYSELGNYVNNHNNQNMGTSPNVDSKHLSISTVHTRTLIPEEEDFVKPLSPKTHHVEKELRDIGMRDLDESSNTLNFEEREYPVNDISNQHILPHKDTFGHALHNEYHEENLASIPDSSNIQTSPDPPSKEKSIFKYRPGEGPCRSCNLDIDPKGRGSQRAIHSKSGELLGQWHRGCFHCSYPGCRILFNRHVQCYVLNDLPFCRQHYHEQNNTICENCKHGIEGECVVNELEQKWHLHCLLCHACNNSINSDYYLINGSVFCEADAEDIINGRQNCGDNTGLTSKDKIEKRRTRLLYVE